MVFDIDMKITYAHCVGFERAHYLV
jgi:hypothetical protein